MKLGSVLRTSALDLSVYNTDGAAAAHAQPYVDYDFSELQTMNFTNDRRFRDFQQGSVKDQTRISMW